jgi:hypothetical protein
VVVSVLISLMLMDESSARMPVNLTWGIRARICLHRIILLNRPIPRARPQATSPGSPSGSHSGNRRCKTNSDGQNIFLHHVACFYTVRAPATSTKETLIGGKLVRVFGLSCDPSRNLSDSDPLQSVLNPPQILFVKSLAYIPIQFCNCEKGCGPQTPIQLCSVCPSSPFS